ncbi:hypothetical protein [Tepidimonas sp.]|mgnify:CR=1 FL=1|uniref:hypothetical protein n=1 Tax=Tepidimonas sp. TaxID=2002775 RepID=UPI002FE418D3
MRKDVFTPAVALLQRLSMPVKMIGLAAVVAVPLLIVAFLLVADDWRDLQTTEKARQGMAAMREVQALAHAVQEWRDTADVAAAGVAALGGAQQQAAQRAAAALRAVHERLQAHPG